VKIILKRVREPVKARALDLVMTGETENSWFLCRKGEQVFTSHLFFIRDEVLIKRKEEDKRNVQGGYLHVVFNDYVTYGVEELDEINMILLR